jgi:hypothetical protein
MRRFEDRAGDGVVAPAGKTLDIMQSEQKPETA